MTSPYDDIIDLPHHVSERRAHMPLRSRAAQFAPFAALTGYEDAVREAERATASRRELCEDDVLELNAKLRLLSERIAETPYAEVTYYVPDKRKPGGEYVTVSGNVRLIEECTRLLVFCGGRRVPIDDISEISL